MTTRDVILDGYTVTRPNDPVLLDAFEALEAGGGTDLNAGLTYGYYYADTNRSEDMVNRIVLVSDGGANAGVTEADIIANYAGNRDEDGIYMGSRVRRLPTTRSLDTVTDVGRGASIYADHRLGWKTTAPTSSTRWTWSPATCRCVSTYRPVSRSCASRARNSADPTEIEPQHLAPNDSMVFCRPSRPALPSRCRRYRGGHHRDVEGPHQLRGAGATLQMPFELMAADQTLLHKGLAIYEYAESLKVWRDREVPTTERAAAISKAAEAVDAAMSYDLDDLDLQRSSSYWILQ